MTVPGTGQAPATGPAPERAGVRLALLLGQLVLLLLVIRAFELENRTVFYLLVGAVAGFAIHALLPLRYRLPSFGLLSVAAVLAVLGWRDGAIVLGVGYLLIGVSRLRAPLWLRLALIGAVAAALVGLRLKTTVFAGPSAVVVAALGSMFMFRLALYLHALHHQEAPAGLAWSTAYFFMLPNICYPLFPVVDYTTFVRTHFDAERFRTYERGVRFLLRGVLQLLVYRLVYYELAIDSLYVNNLADLVRFLVSNFLLYVKISGQFWLIIGVLGLFGFRLPETNHLYFLASSPTDFWRRINIYWKDFMMKLVYYPSFFRLRRYGNTVAVGLATVIVFLVTWLLHAYQYYWLQNEWSLSKRDILFWGLFGVIVVAFALWEARPGRRRAPKTARRWSFARGTATVATFSLIAVLWSLWNARTLPTWLFMWAQVKYSTPGQWAGLAGLLLAAVGLAGFAWGAPTLAGPPLEPEPASAVIKRAATRGIALACLAALPLPVIRAMLPHQAEEVVGYLRGEGHAPASDLLDLGYYGQLTVPHIRTATPWQPPPDFSRDDALLQPVPNLLRWRLQPSTRTTFAGAEFSTNSLGLRGRDYDVAKPPGTYRIEIYGPSDVMGWGVADSDVFTARLEAKLDSAARTRGQRVEVLNFGMAGANPAQQVYRLQQTGLRFSPDLVLLTLHAKDLLFFTWVFQKEFEQHRSLPDSEMARLVERVGLGPGRQGNLANLRLIEEQLDRRLLRWSTELAGGSGARVAVLLITLPSIPFDGNLATSRRAAAAEHLPVFDCMHVFAGRPLRSLQAQPRDEHPNAMGHRLIAECVFDHLQGDAGPLAVRPLLGAAQ